jgi:hypothetical protein
VIDEETHGRVTRARLREEDESAVLPAATRLNGAANRTGGGVTTRRRLPHRPDPWLRLCGDLINDRGSGPADFAFSPSLRQASVVGTITTGEGRSVTVDMTWEGTGPMETTSNTTTFPGFTGHFIGNRREAVATGTVVVDGETLVDGSTTSAEIQTLEDKNISHP